MCACISLYICSIRGDKRGTFGVFQQHRNPDTLTVQVKRQTSRVLKLRFRH